MWAARPSNNPEILVPVVAVPPDLLDVELDASTEIKGRVLLAHAPFFIYRCLHEGRPGGVPNGRLSFVVD
jgi:hypothetical protein